MKSWRIHGSGPLRGVVRVPSDKSIGHRTLMFASLAEGPSTIRGISRGLDNLATAKAFEAMGVQIAWRDHEARVEGVGLNGLKMPTQVIDCGNSGTTMRLLAGLLAGQRFGTRMVGDASLQKRPMRRVIEPLRQRGAHIAGVSGAKPDEIYPPISIAPLIEGEGLSGIEYVLPVASAQVKSALLLSGLYADGPTSLKEPTLSRDHTERMMIGLGVPLQTMGNEVTLDPRQWSRRWSGFDWDVPGDFSSAAFLIVAALVVPDSQIRIEFVGTNPTRTGLLDVVRAMGGRAAVLPKGHAAGEEPVGDIEVIHSPCRGGSAGGELVTRMIDEVPALCALATFARGKTHVLDAKELRVKESDRIKTMHDVLVAFGVTAAEQPDGMTIEGGATLKAARVQSHGDHRIAMSAALIAMRAPGESIIEDVECVDTSFPGFRTLLNGLGAHIEEVST